MVNFLFSVHTIAKAKQSNSQGGGSSSLARPGVGPPLIVLSENSLFTDTSDLIATVVTCALQ